MGNLCARNRPLSPPASPEKSHDPENPRGGAGQIKELKAAQLVPQRKLDPKDFMVVKQENQVVVKKPGSINGQMFIIEDCKNCDIYLLDHTAQITVDACENCRVFIGPCESSVFLRDCINCKWIIACQQLRLRDCTDMDMLLYVSAGQPSIESSSDIRLGCFDFAYFSLKQHFDAAGLSVWNNQWDNVHDFSQSASGQNWSFLKESVKARDVLPALGEVAPDMADEAQLDCPVPPTQGSRPRDLQPCCFLLVWGAAEENATRIVSDTRAKMRSGEVTLVRSRRTKLTKEQAASLLGQDQRCITKASTGYVVGLQFEGPRAEAVLGEAARELLASGHCSLSQEGQGEVHSSIFFEKLRPVI